LPVSRARKRWMNSITIPQAESEIKI